ncbi:amino acid/polyamine/organocation transporter, APC superfamily [Pseudarcicella hirudinis]|uniref:Amino acid/polyamine/organocation transporter, APC superfamily n=1 Tax=Pseudarcicella hirudinis TaxID=1079859 RepID=A0A1I5MF87_9BACT|nr:amino acid permease [Pseudarcicella hirudinis]SFP08245.1 amino acid/polyamine/organocation transporter, APC superfamily [Pseudarcicella hirudinis]
MEKHQQFKRELGLLDSTMIVIGSMIGSGIFIVSADVTRNLGSPGYLLLAWVITGIITLISALSYGELAGMMPNAGGQYVYLREAYNPLVGFLFGWTTFLVIETGTIAAVAVAFAKYTGVLFPKIIGTEHKFLIFDTQQLLAIALILFLTFVNLKGVRNAKLVQLIFTVTKIGALLALAVIGIIVGTKVGMWEINSLEFWTPQTIIFEKGKIVDIKYLSGLGLWSAMGLALIGPLFSSSAWNNITYTAGEVKDPKRNIPLSLLLGTLTVSALYILANVAYLMLLPAKGSPAGADTLARGIMFASNDRVGTAAAEMIFGNPGVFIMAIFIMISTFGCNNGIILSGARVYYAMAKDGLFFKKAGDLNSKGVPGFSLVIQCVWACLLCLSGTYGDLLDYTVFSILVFYILTIAGVFILRKRQPDAPRPYKAFGYPLIPAIYLIFAVALCINLLIFKPVPSWAGVGIVALGIPVFYFWRKKKAD